ncbi:hypothetical protein CIB84_013680 [Bambusicola thoracicus]|uniref:Uncharacterized protein n=1 Tax=Bambusicola thoracicus TaxID=9083 RepID=A0A2P4SEP5_BAMTH|nr:hypothetical protein CIB84_013680 [Bambusicola thoracicus]
MLFIRDIATPRAAQQV